MDYNELITRKIDFDSNKNKIITENLIIDELEKCYKNTAFSTFPYIREGLNSSQSIQKYHSGNCISLSMFIKNELNKKNINSFLIPATIPKKYQSVGYLDISHVVLCIPVSKKEFFIADPAFYFLNPIHVQIGKPIKTVFSKNIYTKEYSSELSEYTSIDAVNCKLNYFKNRQILNEFQFFPPKTIYIECSYQNEPLDTWKYFIREVINPDTAITSFYVTIKNKPFLTSTIIDKNGIPTMGHYITSSQGGGYYSYGFKNKRFMTHEELEKLRGNLNYFFGSKLPLY